MARAQREPSKGPYLQLEHLAAFKAFALGNEHEVKDHPDVFRDGLLVRLKGNKDWYAVLWNKAFTRFTADRRLATLVRSFEMAEKAKLAPGAQPSTSQDEDDLRDCPAAGPFINWRALHRPLIQSTVDLLGGAGQLNDDAHWTLIDEMKGALGADSANDTADEVAQADALMDAETWVASELGDGLLEEDVAMALWLGHKDTHDTTLAWLKANLTA